MIRRIIYQGVAFALTPLVSAAVSVAPATPNFDTPKFARLSQLGEITAAPTGFVANTPQSSTPSAIFDSKVITFGKWLITDFSGAASAPSPIAVAFQEFDRPVFRRRAPDHMLGFVQQPTATVTPTTAGLQDLTPVLFQRPWRPSGQQVTTNVPASVSVAATPTTVGLQDFAPWLFVKPFKAITATGTFVPANTPITAGLQDFGPLFQKPLKASLQQHEVNTPSGTYIVANTPITGGIQGFDFAYKKAFSSSLQALGTWGVSTIVIAATPSSFQFASLDMKALRQVFPAYQQQFVAAQMIGDVPAPPAVTEVHNFPFIANVGTMMQRW